MHSTTHSRPWRRLDLGIALAGEDPADRAAGRPAAGRRAISSASRSTARLRRVGVGVGEVGRAAEHRHGEARPRGSPRRPGRGRRLEAGEEAVVHLQPVGVERPGHLDPVEDRHGPVAGDLVDVALREGGDLQGMPGTLWRSDRGDARGGILSFRLASPDSRFQPRIGTNRRRVAGRVLGLPCIRGPRDADRPRRPGGPSTRRPIDRGRNQEARATRGAP